MVGSKWHQWEQNIRVKGRISWLQHSVVCFNLFSHMLHCQLVSAAKRTVCRLSWVQCLTSDVANLVETSSCALQWFLWYVFSQWDYPFLDTISLLMGCIFWLSILDHSSMSLRLSERAVVVYIQLKITTNQTTCGTLWKRVKYEGNAAAMFKSSTKQMLRCWLHSSSHVPQRHWLHVSTRCDWLQ